MDTEKKKKISRILKAAAIGELILAIAMTVWGAMKGTMNVRQRLSLLGAAMAIYWLLTDLAEPLLLRRFANRTAREKIAYLRFLAFDLLGYVGILCFLSGVGGIGGANRGLLGGVLYVVAMRPRRENQRSFYEGE